MKWKRSSHPLGPCWISQDGTAMIVQAGPKFIRFDQGCKGASEDRRHDSLKDAMEAPSDP